MRHTRNHRTSPPQLLWRGLILLLIGLLTLAVLGQLAPPKATSATESVPFTDVPAWQWYAQPIALAREAGLISGYADGSFRPQGMLTCAEFLRMTLPTALITPSTPGNHWARGYYADGLDRQLFTEDDLRPAMLDAPMPRKLMALIYAGLLEEAPAKGQAPIPRADYTDVPDDFTYEYPIALASSRGILAGYPDGSFRPEGYLTRAEAASAALRLLEALPEADQTQASQKPADTPPSIASMADPVLVHYLDAILASVRFEGSGGNYSYRFEAPALPEGYKNFFKINFFSPQNAYTLTENRYATRNSEAHIINNPILSLRDLGQLGTVIMEIAVCRLDDGNWLSYLLEWNTNTGTELRIEYENNELGISYLEYPHNPAPLAFSWK